MDNVFVPNIDATQSMEIVRELRAKGLVQGIDFNFSYQHHQYNYDEMDFRHLRGCKFSFRDNKWITFFRLKYDGSI